MLTGTTLHAIRHWRTVGDWLRDEHFARRIAAACDRIGVTLVPILDHADLLRFLDERRSTAGAASALVLTEAGTQREAVELIRVVVAHPRLRIALLTRGERSLTRLPGVPPSARARIHPVNTRTPDRVCTIVGDLSLSVVSEALAVRARQAVREESIRLREAVSELLAGRPLWPDLSGSPPVDSITALASRLGLSRSYTARLARGAGVELTHLIDLWRVILAMHVRTVWQAPWDVVAWRVGFASHSGLAALVQRTTGMTLTELDRSSFEQLLTEFHAALRRESSG